MPGRTLLVVAALGGVFLGAVVFTLDYAHGLSYLSSDSAACANCHIMQPQYVSWQRAAHREVAGCVDCHLPQRGLAKWISKADNGWRHTVAFTLQNFHEPIVMRPVSRRTLQSNCIECHGGLTHDVTAISSDPVECVHCHRDAGHGERLGLGGPAGRSDLFDPADAGVQP
jgi:cytochrome c nitrite reductase small subunit